MISPRSDIEAWDEWRQQRLARLVAADGWLNLIDLVWLDDGVHRVGSDTDCAVRMPSGPSHWGDLVVNDGEVRWRSAHEGERLLATDSGANPDVVRNGRYSFIVIERDGKLAVRLRDAEAKTRMSFNGIPLFSFDPAWRKPARWIDGAATFAHGGLEYRLVAQDPDANPLHFVFADATSGYDTYGGGRFLYADASREGQLLLDFNRAFNPPCVFTPYAMCPLPPPGNRLNLAIDAGEKLPS